MSFIITFVEILTWVLTIAIFGRAILSYFPAGGNHPLVAIVYQITEPILAPIRRVVPRLGIFDLTPMVAILLLFLIRRVVSSL